MGIEILDLVDPNDNVIGAVEKDRANRDPRLIHREVAVVIYDEAGRVLFQKRAAHKQVRPGVWGISCAGHVDRGEDPETTAHRELREELGFDTKLSFTEKRLVREPRETHFAYCYVGAFPGGALTLQAEEVERAEFLDAESLERLAASEEIEAVSIGLARTFWGKV